MEESAGMAASVEEADDLFDILTQNKVYTVPDGEGAFPDVDELFSQVPFPSEFDISLAEDSSTPVSLGNHNGADNSRFAPIVSDSEVAARQRASVPVNTRKNSNWAFNVWREYRQKRDPSDAPRYLLTMGVDEINKWLSRFVLLHVIREYNPTIDLFKSPEFASFRKTLDAEMKRIKANAIVPTQPKRAKPIQEEMLWSKGVLGCYSPQALVDTMLFMCGLYFALRSGDEHRNLRFSSIELLEKEGSTPYLIYTETVSKNNPGGLKHRKVQPKQVKHFANTQCPERCFIEMYKNASARKCKKWCFI